MAEEKDTDTTESLGYEKEINQWKEDLQVARRQVNLKNSKIDQVFRIVE